MTFKDILVHLDDSHGHEARLHLACELARRHEAHLVGLHVLGPLALGAMATPAISGYVTAETIQMVQERYRQGALAAAARAEAAFHAETGRAGVTGEWRRVEGEPGEVATLHARYADIAVLGQADPDDPNFAGAARLPESVLLGAGRPVLIVPYVGSYETVGRNVLVAWSATREAARAVNDALPILRTAERVTVLSINPVRGIAGEGDVPAADIAHHLARHDVRAEAAYTVAEDIGVGDIILSRAADLGSDLLVMGGYGHSRTRQLILGGATRSILEHMTLPVLLSH